MHFPKLLVKDNTDAREEVLNHRLLYDLKLAAAERDYHLLSYVTDVDHDGFDVILDDRDNFRKIQLKSTVNKGTNSWGIHKGLLRPSFRTLEALGFEPAPLWGTEGAVILIDVIDETLNQGQANEKKLHRFEYSFTDIYYISLIATGVVAAPAPTVEAAKRVRKEIWEGKATDKTDVPRGLFLPAKDPSALLALAGFHSVYRHMWQGTGVRSIGYRLDPDFKLKQGETQTLLDERTLKAIKEANGEKVD
jgi:hypothetical protein